MTLFNRAVQHELLEPVHSQAHTIYFSRGRAGTGNCWKSAASRMMKGKEKESRKTCGGGGGDPALSTTQKKRMHTFLYPRQKHIHHVRCKPVRTRVRTDTSVWWLTVCALFAPLHTQEYPQHPKRSQACNLGLKGQFWGGPIIVAPFEEGRCSQNRAPLTPYPTHPSVVTLRTGAISATHILSTNLVDESEENKDTIESIVQCGCDLR